MLFCLGYQQFNVLGLRSFVLELCLCTTMNIWWDSIGFIFIQFYVERKAFKGMNHLTIYSGKIISYWQATLLLKMLQACHLCHAHANISDWIVYSSIHLISNGFFLLGTRCWYLRVSDSNSAKSILPHHSKYYWYTKNYVLQLPIGFIFSVF